MSSESLMMPATFIVKADVLLINRNEAKFTPATRASTCGCLAGAAIIAMCTLLTIGQQTACQCRSIRGHLLCAPDQYLAHLKHDTGSQ
jgi:hypothetical protein